MINLKIDPEFQSQIPPLTDDEFKQLEENILKEGKLISPLIVWGNTLVDGHNQMCIRDSSICGRWNWGRCRKAIFTATSCTMIWTRCV